MYFLSLYNKINATINPIILITIRNPITQKYSVFSFGGLIFLMAVIINGPIANPIFYIDTHIPNAVPSFCGSTM